MTNELTFTPEQQEFVDSLVGKVRIEARERAQKDLAELLENQKQEAERNKLAANAEYKELSERLTEQVGQLTSFKDKATQFEEIMAAVLKNAMEGLPEEAKSAVESLPGDTSTKLDWLTKNRSLLAHSPGDDVGTPMSSKHTKEEAKVRKGLIKGI